MFVKSVVKPANTVCLADGESDSFSGLLASGASTPRQARIHEKSTNPSLYPIFFTYVVSWIHRYKLELESNEKENKQEKFVLA